MTLPDPAFVPECYLKRRTHTDGTLEVLVRWLGHDASLDTWEPAQSLPSLLEDTGALAKLPEEGAESEDDEIESSRGKTDSRRPNRSATPTHPSSGEKVYDIEKILFVYTDEFHETRLLIKWAHYPISQATWEPISNLMDREGMADCLREARKRSRYFFGLHRPFNPSLGSIASRRRKNKTAPDTDRKRMPHCELETSATHVSAVDEGGVSDTSSIPQRVRLSARRISSSGSGTDDDTSSEGSRLPGGESSRRTAPRISTPVQLTPAEASGIRVRDVLGPQLKPEDPATLGLIQRLLSVLKRGPSRKNAPPGYNVMRRKLKILGTELRLFHMQLEAERMQRKDHRQRSTSSSDEGAQSDPRPETPPGDVAASISAISMTHSGSVREDGFVGATAPVPRAEVTAAESLSDSSSSSGLREVGPSIDVTNTGSEETATDSSVNGLPPHKSTTTGSPATTQEAELPTAPQDPPTALSMSEVTEDFSRVGDELASHERVSVDLRKQVASILSETFRRDAEIQASSVSGPAEEAPPRYEGTMPEVSLQREAVLMQGSAHFTSQEEDQVDRTLEPSAQQQSAESALLIDAIRLSSRTPRMAESCSGIPLPVVSPSILSPPEPAHNAVPQPVIATPMMTTSTAPTASPPLPNIPAAPHLLSTISRAPRGREFPVSLVPYTSTADSGQAMTSEAQSRAHHVGQLQAFRENMQRRGTHDWTTLNPLMPALTSSPSFADSPTQQAPPFNPHPYCLYDGRYFQTRPPMSTPAAPLAPPLYLPGVIPSPPATNPDALPQVSTMRPRSPRFDATLTARPMQVGFLPLTRGGTPQQPPRPYGVMLRPSTMVGVHSDQSSISVAGNLSSTLRRPVVPQANALPFGETCALGALQTPPNATYNKQPVSASRSFAASLLNTSGTPTACSDTRRAKSQKAPSPRMSHLKFGVALAESKLWIELRSLSVHCSTLIARTRQTALIHLPLHMRCYCQDCQYPPEDSWPRLHAKLHQLLPTVLSNGIQCQICFQYIHAQCAIGWLTLSPGPTHVDESELSTFIKTFVCQCCRVITSEPLMLTQRILSMHCGRGPGDPPAGTASKNSLLTKSFSFNFTLTAAEVGDLEADRACLQVRCFDLKIPTYRQYAFPHQVTFWVNHPPALHRQAASEYTIKPPALHRKRREAPWDVPVKALRLAGANRIQMDCNFLADKEAFNWYLIAVVVAKPVPVESVLHAVQTGSVVPLDTARRLCHALLSEASRLTEDEVEFEHQNIHQLSLRCPSTLMRIDLPGRGFECTHVQCFDLVYYIHSQLQISSHRNRWKCPVCYRLCLPHEIIVDSFCAEILSKTTPADKTALLLFKEGHVSWRIIEKDELPSSSVCAHVENNESLLKQLDGPEQAPLPLGHQADELTSSVIDLDD